MPTTYTSARWAYDGPVLTVVTPPLLAPHPAPDLNLTLTGVNFGWLPGVVTAGSRTLACPAWSNSEVVCVAPPGAPATVPLTLTTAAGVQSPASPRAALHFAPPSILSVAFVPPSNTPGPSGNGSAASDNGAATSDNGSATSGPAVGRVVCPAEGGGVLLVTADSLAAPLPVSAWLVRGPQALAPPFWDPTACEALGPDRGLLPCALVPGSPVVPGTLSCVVPAGLGMGWRLVVVNHDPEPGAVGADYTLPAPALGATSQWQASAPSPEFVLDFAAPVVEMVRVGGGGAPRLGGFQVEGEEYRGRGTWDIGAGGVGHWGRGCVGVWACGCVGVGQCGHVWVWCGCGCGCGTGDLGRGHVGVWVCGRVGVWA